MIPQPSSELIQAHQRLHGQIIPELSKLVAKSRQGLKWENDPKLRSKMAAELVPALDRQIKALDALEASMAGKRVPGGERISMRPGFKSRSPPHNSGRNPFDITYGVWY